MRSAMRLPRSSVPWSQSARLEEQVQQSTTAEPQNEALFYAPQKVEYQPKGAEKPREEAWFVHRLFPGGRLERTLVVVDHEMQRLMELPDEKPYDPVDLARLKTMRRYQYWSTERLLRHVRQFSLDALTKGFKAFDHRREMERTREVTSARTATEARVPMLAVSSSPARASTSASASMAVPLLAVDEGAPHEASTLGISPQSKLHDGDGMLRGQLIAWGTYQGQDDGGGDVPHEPEEWFVAVQTDKGPRHLIDVDLKRAFAAKNPAGGDTIRIVKRRPEDGSPPLHVTEERHGSHGDGTRELEVTRENVFDIEIEDKPNLYGAEAYRFGGRRPERNHRRESDDNKRKQRIAAKEQREDEEYS